MATVDFTDYQVHTDGPGILMPNSSCVVSGYVTNNSSKYISYIKYFVMNANYVAAVLAESIMIEPGWEMIGSCVGRTLKMGESVAPNTNMFTYMNSQTPVIRSMTIDRIFVIVTFTDKTQFQTVISLPASRYVPAITELWKPTIQNLAFTRCDSNKAVDDEGEHVLTTLKTSFASAQYADRFDMTIKQYNSDSNELLQTITINSGDSRLQQFYSGITNSDIFFNSFSSFSKEHNYKIVVEIGDNLEKAVLSYSVPAAYVNLHLSSAANGGVAIGKLSGSTDNNPEFECAYPALFYSDVRIDGQLLNVVGGIVQPGNITITSSAAYRECVVNYGVTFEETPFVVATLYGDMGYPGSCSCFIKSIGKTSFTVVGTLGTGSLATSIGFTWMAYGTLASS